MIRANMLTGGGDLAFVTHGNVGALTTLDVTEGNYYMLYQNSNSVPSGGHICTAGGTILGNFTGDDTYSGRSCICELVLATSNQLTLYSDYVHYAEYAIQ